ncbi:MAG TPA: calcium-binding protein [Gaiellaceae bacterium]|nr:calcium-binding protein [Gaiellaceae bacterium]
MKVIKGKKTRGRKKGSDISGTRLAEMIEEATVDAYSESEQATGWFTMFESYLELPFVTDVLGVRVTVEAIDLRDDNHIVAACRRGKEKLAIGIVDLPLPSPRPEGAEWIEAYRRWCRSR